MRYINILTVGSNTHIPQSITAVCQLDILYFSETFHFNYRYTSRHYVHFVMKSLTVKAAES